MAPLTNLTYPLVFDIGSIVIMEEHGCTKPVIEALPLPCLIAVDTKIELDLLRIGDFLKAPLIQIVGIESETEAIDLVELAAKGLSNAEAASIVIAKSRDLVLVTDDRHAIAISSQDISHLKLVSIFDVINHWHKSRNL